MGMEKPWWKIDTDHETLMRVCICNVKCNILACCQIIFHLCQPIDCIITALCPCKTLKPSQITLTIKLLETSLSPNTPPFHLVFVSGWTRMSLGWTWAPSINKKDGLMILGRDMWIEQVSSKKPNSVPRWQIVSSFNAIISNWIPRLRLTSCSNLSSMLYIISYMMDGVVKIGRFSFGFNSNLACLTLSWRGTTVF